jgi:hypothetical protein
MTTPCYTLAAWHVRNGQTDAFLQIWREELANAFRAVNPAARGTLIQSLDDPQLFYSFGPWASLEEMQAARVAPQVRAAISKLMGLCELATPGAYQVVLTIP